MRFVIRPSDIERLYDILTLDQFKGIAILGISLLIAVIFIAVKEAKRSK